MQSFQAGAGGVGSPWWKVTRFFIRTDSVMAHLFLVLLATQRQYEQENHASQMHSCLHTGVSMLLFVCGKKKFLETPCILVTATGNFECVLGVVEHVTMKTDSLLTFKYLHLQIWTHS
jgi:hypothetical protein